MDSEREIVYHPRVPDEARELVAYYDNVATELGDTFWVELQAAVEDVRKIPKGTISIALV